MSAADGSRQAEAGLARTVIWGCYWLLVAVTAALTALTVGGAGGVLGAGVPVVALATLAPPLWLVLGAPPGYRALAERRQRLGTRAPPDGDAPSALRTGFELLAAALTIVAVPAVLLFSGVEGTIGLLEQGEGVAPAALVADGLGLGPQGPSTLFALAVVGLLLAALASLVVWVTA